MTNNHEEIWLIKLKSKVNKVVYLAEKLSVLNHAEFISKMNTWFARKRTNPTLYMLKLLKFKRDMMILCNACIVESYKPLDKDGEFDEEEEKENEEFNNEFTRSLYLSKEFRANNDNITDKVMELTVQLTRNISVIHDLFTEYYPRPVKLIRIAEDDE
jgi:hypothetical protein